MTANSPLCQGWAPGATAERTSRTCSPQLSRLIQFGGGAGAYYGYLGIFGDAFQGVALERAHLHHVPQILLEQGEVEEGDVEAGEIETAGAFEVDGGGGAGGEG